VSAATAPQAPGFGIYLVFWFGDDRPSAIPLPPGGQPRPTSTVEMEAMLRASSARPGSPNRRLTGAELRFIPLEMETTQRDLAGFIGTRRRRISRTT
jgi:hypothetical protein